MNRLLSFFALAFFVVTVSSCSEEETVEPVLAKRIDNLAADPATGFDPNTGAPIGSTGRFTLFSFKTGEILSGEDANLNSTKWDIGFRGTTIIVNSGSSGPGTAQAQIVSGIFDQLVEAPASGYASDATTNGTPSYAIPTGSGRGWYTATQTSPTIITPIAGKVIIVKTVDGRYAKMEILSYYKDAPASPTGNEPARYYTFRYVYQPNDTRSFQ